MTAKISHESHAERGSRVVSELGRSNCQSACGCRPALSPGPLHFSPLVLSVGNMFIKAHGAEEWACFHAGRRTPPCREVEDALNCQRRRWGKCTRGADCSSASQRIATPLDISTQTGAFCHYAPLLFPSSAPFFLSVSFPQQGSRRWNGLSLLPSLTGTQPYRADSWGTGVLCGPLVASAPRFGVESAFFLTSSVQIVIRHCFNLRKMPHGRPE